MTWLATIPPLAVYLTVGGLVGLESTGIPLPGETALIAGAILSALPGATVSPLGVALAAFAGAVIGDSFGYAIGRRFGPRLFAFLIRRFPKHLSAAHVAYAEHLFSTHGAKVVFVGRFVAVLRILAGPLSGSLHMPYAKFFPANALGGAVWAGTFTAAAYYFGEAAHTWLSGIGWVIVGAMVVAAVLLGRTVRRNFERRVEEYAKLHPTAVGVPPTLTD